MKRAAIQGGRFMKEHDEREQKAEGHLVAAQE
jgi:hypothetical protein